MKVRYKYTFIQVTKYSDLCSEVVLSHGFTYVQVWAYM